MRVARNIRLADMNVDVLVVDARCEWPTPLAWAQFALESPLTRLGEAHPRADVV